MPYRTDERLSLEESARRRHENRVILHRQWRAEHKERIAELTTLLSVMKRARWSTLEWATIEDVIKEAKRRGDIQLVQRATAHLQRRPRLERQRRMRLVK